MDKFLIKSLSFSLIFFGIGFIFIYFVRGTFTDGQILDANSLNKVSPSGEISAFNLTTCPTGRKPADGTDGTPDLRGKFIRGLNSFDGGATVVTLTQGDQDGASRILGSYQADQYKSHSHGNVRNYSVSTPQGAYGLVSGNGTNTGSTSTANSGGTETRPKNVAVIFCIKE